MPFYNRMKRTGYRQRASTSLLRLREQLRAEIPPRTVRDTLLLATWNIRDFDSNKFGHGPRLSESYYYIAEIISAFDLVAVQEVNDDLRALKRVKDILGPTWKYITTDITEGRSGNQERMAFVYDERKILFRNLAGEIVLPQEKLVEGSRQFARTPFVVAFQAGWYRFMLSTVHIYYGSDTGAKLKRRIAEIEKVAQFLAKRAKKDSGNSYILLGDFNIFSPEHKTMKALEDNGFTAPKQLETIPSNMRQDRHYDQIAFMEQTEKVGYSTCRFGDHAGVFNLYESVFRDEDADTYYDVVKKSRDRKTDKWDRDDEGKPRTEKSRAQYYENTWRTFQMSDHLPMWIELEIDFSKEYLEGLAE